MDAKRIGIPDELNGAKYKNREVHSATVRKRINNSASTHTTVQKKKVERMSWCFCPLRRKTMVDGKDKPAIDKLYDFTKGGGDIVDQLNQLSTQHAPKPFDGPTSVFIMCSIQHKWTRRYCIAYLPTRISVRRTVPSYLVGPLLYNFKPYVLQS